MKRVRGGAACALATGFSLALLAVACARSETRGVDSSPGTVAVDVTPTGAEVLTGGRVQFTAAVSGSADLSVTWRVTESAGGSVDASGSYTAPSSTGTYHVVATSRADTSRSGSATVTVLATAPGPGGAPVLYSGDRTQSPIDASMAQRLKDIAASGSGLRPAVFMKVGDSNSILSYQGFMSCFDGDPDGLAVPSPTQPYDIFLDGRTQLKDTILYFRSVPIGSTSPYGRSSLATVAGTKAGDALAGVHPTLIQEYDAAKPQFALIMFGSNDIQGDLPANVAEYEAAMRGITDALLSRGVIPILSTMPERQDDPRYPAMVPAFNGVVRAIAQGRRIPLVDNNREWWPLAAAPGNEAHGMSADGVHLSYLGFNTSCWFRAAQGDLLYGQNSRNLATLEALHRLKQVFVDGAAPPDPAAPHLAGDGSASAPFEVPSLPFADMHDTRQSPNRAIPAYSCAGSPAGPGAEYLYRFTLPRRTAIRAVVLDAKANEVSVAILSRPSGAACLESASRVIATTLDPGVYYLVVDSLAADGGAEYTLSLTECRDGDAACAN